MCVRSNFVIISHKKCDGITKTDLNSFKINFTIMISKIYICTWELIKNVSFSIKNLYKILIIQTNCHSIIKWKCQDKIIDNNKRSPETFDLIIIIIINYSITPSNVLDIFLQEILAINSIFKTFVVKLVLVILHECNFKY